MSRKKEPASKTENYPFPTRLRKLMEETKTTQRELAVAIGVRPQTVSLYTQGQSFPDVNGLAKIARHFGISADYLIGNSKMPNADLSMQDIHKITGLSAGAICKLQNIFDTNRKTAFSDIISLLIEDSNSEYFLRIICELISCSLDGSSEEMISVDVAGSAMSLPKGKMLKTIFQTSFVDALPRIVTEYKRQYDKTPNQHTEEYFEMLLALKKRKDCGEITEQEFKDIENQWLKGGQW